MKRDRRQFLRGSGIALGAVTAGSFAADGRVASTTRDIGRQSAGFGWEITDIDNNGANAYFEILNAMTLHSVDVDVAFMITALPAVPGFAEVLCVAGVSRGSTPTFAAGPSQYPVFAGSPDFGEARILNPNGLNAFGGGSGETFYQVILKTWVPADGTGSATSRICRVEPGLLLNPSDFLVFHMDHAGVTGDVEMQVSLGYSIGSPRPRVISR